MGPQCRVSVVTASSVIPQRYASPHQPDLLGPCTGSCRRRVVEQATDLNCDRCGAPHRCISWAPPKRWEDKECWLVPELHPRKHNPASLGILHELLGSFTGNFQLPAPTRSKGPRSYSAGWALWWRSAYDGLHRKGDKTGGDWMDCLFLLKGNHNITVAGMPLGS